MSEQRTAPDRAVILQTPRLRLTTWLPADAADLHEVHADAETMRFVRHGRPETPEETRALVAQYLDEQIRLGWTRWRLTDREDRLIGRAGFGAAVDGRELGYTIRRELWGQGLATEIASALVALHRAEPGHGPLTAYVVPENTASARVLTKAGFEYEGVRPRRGVDCLFFRLPG